MQASTFRGKANPFEHPLILTYSGGYRRTWTFGILINSQALYLLSYAPIRKEESLKYILSQLFELNGGGSGRDRTDYLILARDAFSQVNYKPINPNYFASLRKTSSVNVSRYRPRNFFYRFYPVLLTCRLFISLHLPQLLNPNDVSYPNVWILTLSSLVVSASWHLYWQGWVDSNHRMQQSKCCAFPLGDTPI